MFRKTTKIFIFGGSGFVGQNLIEELIRQGFYQIKVLVRTKEERNSLQKFNVKTVLGDILNLNSYMSKIEENSVIFYLIHGLGQQKIRTSIFEIEKRAVENLILAAQTRKTRQIIHLTGIYFPKQKLSSHLLARKLTVEKIKESQTPYTIIRTSIIFGKKSISFEIIKNIILKFPIIPLFKWRSSKVSPIHIKDVIFGLIKVMEKQAFLNKIIDIGGPEVVNYNFLLQKLAKFLGLKRIFLKLPFNLFSLPALTTSILTGFPNSEVYFLFQSLKNDCFCPTSNFKKFFGPEPRSIFDINLFK